MGIGSWPLKSCSLLATPRSRLRHGLGVADPQAQKIVGGVSTIAGAAGGAAGAGLLGAGAASLAAGPVGIAIFAGLALASVLAGFIGGGCGQACIEASQAEQIYERAVDDIYHVAQAGMITANEFLTGAQNFLAAGQQHLTQLLQSGDSKARGGLTNMQSSIGGVTSKASSLSQTRTAILDLNAAASLFGSSAGWYAGSASAGDQAAIAYLQSLPANPPPSPVVTQNEAGVTLAGFTLSPAAIGLGLALLVGGIWIFSGGE